MFCRNAILVSNLASLILLLPLAAAAQTNPPRPPNVLMIISDDQAWTDYGFMGHPHIQTPNLDRLAAEGLAFTRGYSTAPLCRPSLAGMITGLYPHQHRITGNDPNLPAGAPSMASRSNPQYAKYYEEVMAHIEEHPTLPRLLATQGYRSLQTGKWWEGSYRRGGFTEGMTHGDPKRGGRHGDEGLRIGREGLEPIFSFIRRAEQDKAPWFVWYGVFLPHAPHNPPERLLKKYLDIAPTEPIARYWANCEWFDETCGGLLRFLDERGLAENTLVVYVCDNGWIQDPQKANQFAPRSKQSPFEGGIRTPIMLRWPGRIEPKMDRETLVSSIDLAPTILQAAGIQPPAGMPGVNLLDAQSQERRGNRVFAEAYAHNLDAFHPFDHLRFRVVIDGRWKLIQPNPAEEKNAAPMLFDLLADPCEEHDLAGEQAERVEMLQKTLDHWWNPAEETP